MEISPERSRPIRVAAALALAKLLVHLVSLRPYGFFRDELYYIACSRHLDWGYVDQPPFCVALLAAWTAIFGDGLASVRLLAALAGTATVLTTGLLAIELGGGVLAVILAGLSVLTAGQYLGTAHYYSMNVLDQLFWTLGAYLALRAVKEGSPRAWIALGITLGLALLDKTSVLWFGAGLAVGLVVTPARDVLGTRWPWVAAAIAALVFSPYLLWEVRHGWPTLEFMKNALEHKYVARSFASFVGQQIDHHNPFTAPIWAMGLYALVRKRLGPRAAFIGWIFLTAFAIVASQKTSKAEYMSPAYPMLWAAGGVWWERTLAPESRRRMKWAVVGVLTVTMTAGGAVALPFAIALLPEESFIRYQRALGKKPETSERREVSDLGQFYADMHGWRELADAVADIYDGLPPDERAGATIWVRSGGYGPAAAIDYFGRERHLPPAVTGHNGYWFWGPGSGDGKAVIVVGGKPDRVSRYFESFEQVMTFECEYCRPDENHKPIYIGRKMSPPLRDIWDDQRAFD